MADLSPWSKLGLYLNLAYSFPASVGLGILVGWALDRRLGSAPWLTFAGVLLGLGAGFSMLFKTVKILDKRRREGPDGRG